MAESTNKNKITRQQLKALAWMGTLLMGAMIVLSAVNHRKSAAVKGVEVDIKPLPNGDLLMQPVDVTELIHKAFGYEFQSRSVRTVEIERLEQVLEKDPLVQDAEVYLDARDYVRVTVTQREPVIRIIDKDGWNYYLDKNGTRMPLSKHFTARVVVATGSIPVYVPDFLEREKHLLRQLFLLSSDLRKDAFLNAMIGQIFVSSNGDFILAPLIGDQKIVFGKYEDAQEKIQNLKIFYREAMPYEGWRKYRSIDVRYRGQVICK
ncbi:cell division protein FtsQ/DivIB [Haliscomenobacter sp.]|uniref:cell division protein FtsQ/DivIB n=1 Tax=Haliscomenobacter sp. TaxID=2717303 RepID=UPI003593AF36